MTFKRGFYSLFLYLISPMVVLRLLWRSRTNPAYRKRIFERFGFVDFKKLSQPILWLHAVSVGETNAATPLIESLIKNYPNLRILITTTTPTGSERVKTLFSDRVEHCYFPYDLPDVIARFLKHINPKILIVIETEIWPNLFASCHKKDIPVVLVNARLSERSTNAYLKIKGLIHETLSKVDKIAVRSQADALSFKKLGAIDKQIVVAGNIKFDFETDQKLIDKGLQWRQQWGFNRPVIVAASTHEGEEEILLDIYGKLLKEKDNLLLILVPRHPERFEGVYQLSANRVEKGEVCFSTIRHSDTKNYQPSSNSNPEEGVPNIIIGDSMGEMQSWFATADAVFIGGSLVDVGGHNPLEAIAQGKPVVSGQHMFNFRDIVPNLTESGVLTVCETNQSLSTKLNLLLKNKNTDVAVESEKLMLLHRGATARLLEIISRLNKKALN